MATCAISVHREIRLDLSEREYGLIEDAFRTKLLYSDADRRPASVSEYIVALALHDADEWKTTAMETANRPRAHEELIASEP